jgi:hypothetical protein
MKKIRMLALLVMTVSCAFLFTEQNVAEASYCLGPDNYCTSDLSCCSRICCHPNDFRPQCEAYTGGVTNGCF